MFMCYYSYALQSNAVRIPSPSVLLYLLCLPPSCSPTLLPILSLFLFFSVSPTTPPCPIYVFFPSQSLPSPSLAYLSPSRTPLSISPLAPITCLSSSYLCSCFFSSLLLPLTTPFPSPTSTQYPPFCLMPSPDSHSRYFVSEVDSLFYVSSEVLFLCCVHSALYLKAQ